ncbi:hypothetical protein J3Q64DRAFT_1761736 [Phycomyces blakesleeanus]|uniref:TRP C-terminal domain-containing protein n=1 Tax=Phycomyces blakesleeanus TaxID=4837 RepID=A0ABR3AP76_PHYBL
MAWSSLILLIYLGSIVNAQSNITQCSAQSDWQLNATRFYDPTSQLYLINGTLFTSQPVHPLSYVLSTRLKIGVKMTVQGNQSLCHSQCLITNRIPFVQKVITPDTSLPLGDISSTLEIIKDDTSMACFVVNSVGYQHPAWRTVFIYIPVAITVFAALNSFFQSFASLPETERDILLFTSNYANLPAALRLKTPGFFDVIHYCQSIVSLGQLNLAFPSFYPLFISNLGWSFGLFPNKWLDAAIYSIFPSDVSSQSNPTHQGLSFNKRQSFTDTPNSGPGVVGSHFLPVAGTGIANVALALGIDINGQFLTCLVYYLLILAGCLSVCLVIWLVLLVINIKYPRNINNISNSSNSLTNSNSSSIGSIGRSTSIRNRNKKYNNNNNTNVSRKMLDFTIGVGIRSLSLFYLPLLITSLYQLMLSSPWYLTFLAAIIVVFPLILLYGYIGFDLLSVRPSALVYSEPSLLLRFGSLYNTFADGKFYFFTATIVYKFIVSATVAMGQPNPVSQVTMMILVESAYYVLHWTQWPYADQAINIHYIMFGTLRLITTWMTIAFLPGLEVSLDARQWVAYIQIIIHAAALLIMFILPVKNLFILVTGMLDETLFDTSLPPPRMVLWRRRLYNPNNNEVHSGVMEKKVAEDAAYHQRRNSSKTGDQNGRGVGTGTRVDMNMGLNVGVDSHGSNIDNSGGFITSEAVRPSGHINEDCNDNNFGYRNGTAGHEDLDWDIRLPTQLDPDQPIFFKLPEGGQPYQDVATRAE